MTRYTITYKSGLVMLFGVKDGQIIMIGPLSSQPDTAWQDYYANDYPKPTSLDHIQRLRKSGVVKVQDYDPTFEDFKRAYKAIRYQDKDINRGSWRWDTAQKRWDKLALDLRRKAYAYLVDVYKRRLEVLEVWRAPLYPATYLGKEGREMWDK